MSRKERVVAAADLVERYVALRVEDQREDRETACFLLCYFLGLEAIVIPEEFSSFTAAEFRHAARLFRFDVRHVGVLFYEGYSFLEDDVVAFPAITVSDPKMKEIFPARRFWQDLEMEPVWRQYLEKVVPSSDAVFGPDASIHEYSRRRALRELDEKG